RISVPSDKIHSTISDQVGQIPFGMKFLLIEVEIMFLVAFLMPEMIHIAAQNTKEFIKTMPERMILLPVAQVPFAEDASSIANLFQHGSDGHLAPGQTDGFHPWINCPFQIGNPLLIAPGHQRTSGGSADRCAGI